MSLAARLGAPTLLTLPELAQVAKILYRESGITLSEKKQQMASARLRRRLQPTGCGSFAEYIRLVERDAKERGEFVDLLTTNETRFHRESAHFDYLSEVVSRRSRPVVMWCAAASTGQEPYQLAMTLRDSMPQTLYRASRILATDISPSVLATCRAGIYSQQAVDPLPDGMEGRHFVRDPAHPGDLSVHPDVRRCVTFARLNLMGKWPMKGPFDYVFIRNVMIYFDRPTREKLVSRIRDLIVPDGLLVVSHSESLSNGTAGFKLVRPSVYKKVSS